jgi:3-dehydroquinate synthase
VEVPDGEQQKDLQVAAYCWDVLGQIGFTRTGRARRDRAAAPPPTSPGSSQPPGCAASPSCTCRRRCWAWVDAAVGGKTGINTGAGKNLVGAFHPPAGVVCELTALTTLPRHDYVAGLAEVLKVGFTHDPRILELVEQDPEAAKAPAGPHTRELVERAIAVKAAWSSDDLTEQGQREFLNYGHTLGHAIEKVESTVAARGGGQRRAGVHRRAARLAGRLDDETAARHRSVLEAVGLPTTYAGDWAKVHAAMRVDKKSRGSRLRFVVLDGARQPAHARGPRPVAAGRGVRGGPQGPDRGVRRVVPVSRAGARASTGAQPRAGSAPASRRSTARRPTQQLVGLCEATGDELGLASRSGRPTTRRTMIGWLHEAADAARPSC